MLDDETADRIEADAARRGMPKGAVARDYLRAGIGSVGALVDYGTTTGE